MGKTEGGDALGGGVALILNPELQTVGAFHDGDRVFKEGEEVRVDASEVEALLAHETVSFGQTYQVLVKVEPGKGDDKEG